MNELFFFSVPVVHLRFASNFAIEKISHLLEGKGMKAEVALSLASALFQDSSKASLYLYNLQHYFDKEVMGRVYEYLSNKALFRQKFHFGSYDALVGMMQSVYRTQLNEQELLHIRHLAKANHLGIALLRS